MTQTERDGTIERVGADPRDVTTHWVGPALFGVWLLVLCFIPDPRPLGAPEWTVALLRRLVGLAEPAARLIATLALRAMGFALLGALWMLALRVTSWNRRSLLAVLVAPLLAIGVLWFNLGFFPIALQIQIVSFSVVTGAIAYIALQRRPFTAVGLGVALCAIFAWGTATTVHDELAAAARVVARQLLDSAGDVPDGDAGHARLIERAFRIAAEESRNADPVLANRAAILALSVILGEEKIATVARREIDAKRIPAALELRNRITLWGRKDWSQHFWVSAGLTLLADSDRSVAIGIAKELMDATPGGSGFAFSDLAADVAGNAFTRAATRDARAAAALAARIHEGVRFADFVPELRDLPEGITNEEFHDRFGGLGGAETRRLADEIERRIAACPGLK